MSLDALFLDGSEGLINQFDDRICRTCDRVEFFSYKHDMCNVWLFDALSRRLNQRILVHRT
jgi:hypothetical protein